jgi:predicted RNase H-like nuclease
VRFVGVDLAWGSRATTGLATVDGNGELLDVADAVTDEQVLNWLGRWATGATMIAFDAPLVVTNPTGARECERLVARYFGRYGLACHPSNTANPSFTDGGRAARLHRTLLRTNPSVEAIEVYPHPAIIVLFGLNRVLPYKNKPGRQFPALRAAMRQLVGHVEGLADADPALRAAGQEGWRAIHRTVEAATRKADLHRVEDRIDAVVCAYIALMTVTRPDTVRTLGGADGGSIVTPVTPAIAELIEGSGGAGGRR